MIKENEYTKEDIKEFENELKEMKAERKIYEAGGGRINKPKPVAQFNLDGKLINVFDSGNEASKKTGICPNSIYYCCNKVRSRKTGGGFIWRFI